MALFQASTRPIVAVVGYRVSGKRTEITVEYDDHKEETLVFDVAAIPMAITQLMSGLASITTTENPVVQTPQVESYSLGFNENGEAAMLVHFQGGATLPFALTEDAISTVQTFSEEARQYMDRKKN